MLSKKMKTLRIFKKFVLLTLASTIGLSSCAVFTSLVNPVQGRTFANGILSYTRYDNQTQYFIDRNNMILPNYIMNAKMNHADNDIVGRYPPKSVDLSFDLPGYDPSRLIFRISKHAQAKPEYKEYVLDSGSQKIHLTVSDDTTQGDVDPQKFYDVEAYDGSVSEENFIGTSQFVAIDSYLYWLDDYVTKFPLIDAKGNPVIYRGNVITNNRNQILLSPGDEVFLTFANRGNFLYNGGKIMCALPTELFPFDAKSIKIVAFASNPDYRYYRTINVSKYMYPYYHNDCITFSPGDSRALSSAASYLLWAPDVMDFKKVGDQPVKYEFHFYKDSVLEENFLFKAVDVTFRI